MNRPRLAPPGDGADHAGMSDAQGEQSRRRPRELDPPDPGRPGAGGMSKIVLVVLFALAIAGQLMSAQVAQQANQQANQEAIDRAAEREEQAPPDQPANQPANPTPEPPADPAADGVAAPSAGDQLLMIAKILVAMPESQRTSLGPLLGSVEQVTRAPADQWRAAVLEVELVGEAQGRQALTEFEANLPPDSPADAQFRADIAAARAVLDGEPLDQAAQQRLVDRHGWFARLLFAQRDEGVRLEVLAQAERALVILTSAIAVAFVALGIGTILLIVFAVLFARGTLRPHFRAPARGGWIYVEVPALFLAGFLLISLVSGMLSGVWEHAGFVLPWLLVIVPLWPVLRGVSWSRTRQDLGFHAGRGVFREMGCGVLGYLAGLPLWGLATLVMLGLLSAFSGDDGPPTPNNPVVEAAASGGTTTIVLVLLLATLWAPLVEEGVFRGALYRHLRAGFGIAISALVTALLFAFLHGYGPLFVPPLIALGITFALLREWRGSLIAAITAHFLHNASLLAFILLLTSA